MIRTLVSAFLPPLRLVVQFFTLAAGHRQIAWGAALGMMIGLIPKGNLIAGVLAVLILATHVNLTSAGLATLLFSTLNRWLDPLAHDIGSTLLQRESLAGFWTTLFNLPVLPWTHLNNTVVLGSCVLALGLLGPVQWSVKYLCERHGPWVRSHLERFQIGRHLDRADRLSKWSVP